MDRVASLRNRFQPPGMLPSLPARRPSVRLGHRFAAASAAPIVASNSTQPGPNGQPVLRAIVTLASWRPHVEAWLFQFVADEMAPTRQIWSRLQLDTTCTSHRPTPSSSAKL